MSIPSGHSVTDMIRAIDCWQRLFFYIFITVFYVNTFVYVARSVAVTASKSSTRQANRDQASSVIGIASAAVSAKPGRAKKRNEKDILLSDDKCTAREKTIIIMQHTITKASTSEGGNNTVEAVKSIFE